MSSFSSFQTASHLGAHSQVSTSSMTFASPYAGPLGGYAMASLSATTVGNSEAHFGSMLDRVTGLGSVLNHQDALVEGSGAKCRGYVCVVCKMRGRLKSVGKPVSVGGIGFFIDYRSAH